MVELIFISLVILLFYIYFGYPLSLLLISKIYSKSIKNKNIQPNVTIIVSAFNEKKVICDKILNSLELDYPKNKFELIVVSDGSTDGTNEIILSFSDNPNIKPIIIEKNQGKTNAINTAVKESQGDIIIFTDANVKLDISVVKYLINNFADEEVGCVCGQLNYYNDENNMTSGSGSLYWRYEEFIKRYESKTGSTMGADGSIFAIRKALYTQLPLEMIDDFSTSMLILSKGKRIIFEQNAKAYEMHTTNIAEELKRRRRIANRVITARRFISNDLKKLKFIDKIKCFFHKDLRYLTFIILILTFMLNFYIYLMQINQFYLFTLYVQLLFYILALIGYLFKDRDNVSKILFIPYYFVFMNIMQFLGIIDALRGKRQITWDVAETAR